MVRAIQRYQAQKKAGETELGFTLIELLIVIVVLGVLAGVTVFALGGVTSQSAVSACNADAKTVDIAVAAYNAQTGYSGSGTTPPAPTSVLLTAGATPYLQSFPNSSHYTITLSTTGVVMVGTTKVPTAVQYDGTTPNPCLTAA